MDIGVGDLVEAVRDCWTAEGRKAAPAGTRDVVIKVLHRDEASRRTVCGYCRQSVPAGLLVAMVKASRGYCWCTCVWKKIGPPPSREVEDLIALKDEVILSDTLYVGDWVIAD